MKTEQIESIVKKLKESGYGYIAAEELHKIVRLVWSELATDAVFEPLEKEEEHEQKKY